MQLRRETAGDHAAIGELVGLAFDGRTNEPDLVDRLRRRATYRPAYSLVAEHEGRLVGHVMLSEAALVTTDGDVSVLVLAPLSVHPDAQGVGVGSALVRRVLELAGDEGEPCVVVLGDPAYYRRFGFAPAEPLGILPPPGVPAAAFSVSMRPRSSLRGTVQFPPVFSETGTL